VSSVDGSKARQIVLKAQLVCEIWRESCVKARKQVLCSGRKGDLDKSVPGW
jgi:hypothetical protein